jgi:hypothetical protein
MNQDLLFDTPWWLLAALGIAGIVLLVMGNNRQKRQMIWAGLIVLVLAVAWTLVSWFVDTDLEAAVKRTKGIVHAVDQKDWKKFESLLDPRTSFAYYNNREQLVINGKATAERIGLKSVTLTGTEAKQADTLITVDITVLSNQSITMDRPLPTSWRFSYQNLGQGWVLHHIDALPNQQITPEMINKELVRP